MNFLKALALIILMNAAVHISLFSLGIEIDGLTAFLIGIPIGIVAAVLSNE